MNPTTGHLYPLDHRPPAFDLIEVHGTEEAIAEASARIRSTANETEKSLAELKAQAMEEIRAINRQERRPVSRRAPQQGEDTPGHRERGRRR